MNNNLEIEILVKQLLEQCKKNNVSVSGVVSQGDVLLGFSHNHSSKNEGFNNVDTLIKAKGNLEQFLCELSATERKVELTNETTIFANSNPQVFVTSH